MSREYICPVCDHASSRDSNVRLCPKHEADHDQRVSRAYPSRWWRQLRQLVRELPGFIANRLKEIACEIEGHGPFAILHVSTADSRREPPVYCATCNRDVSHLFLVEKMNVVVVVTNLRAELAIFAGLESRHIFQPGERRIYFRGRYHGYDDMVAILSDALMPEEADGSFSRVGPTVRGARAGAVAHSPRPGHG